VAILKQAQYVPMNVVDQILIIYAGTSGGLDDVDVKQVGEFERAFLEHMHERHPDVGAQIVASKKDIPDEVKTLLNQAIAEVKTMGGFAGKPAAAPRPAEKAAPKAQDPAKPAHRAPNK
jgi:F0F1-type ATP synthase alpha subunit